MHVEANYNHRWHNRRPGISARGNYSSDSGPRPTSWSANSVRTKSHRQTITHSHSAHQQVTKSSLEYSNTTIKPYSSVQNSDRTTIVSDRDDYDACRKRKSISEGSSATSPDACTCTVSPFYLESSRLSEPSENSPPGPKALPTHIANRLKERFEKRFLRHYYHSSQVESALAGNRNRTEKSNKYQLVAAFLVSGGIVEAWHIYSPIPVEVGRTNDVTNGGTRNLELTQRRMRLLQRYYSSARQYVVLYVNSSYAEHYLPLGLAVDNSNANGRVPRKTARYHKSTAQSDSTRTGVGVVSRLIASLLPHSRSSRLQQNIHTADSLSAPNETSQSCSSVFRQTSPQSENSKPYRRNQSAPRLRRDDDSSVKSDCATEGTEVGRVRINRHSLMQRFLKHVCSSYGRHSNLTGSKSSSSSSSSANHDRTAEAKHFLGEANEKESSSSGLADFSFATGSSGSESAKNESQKETFSEMPSPTEFLKENAPFEATTNLSEKATIPKCCNEITTSEIWLPQR
ncbi:hypothetical protein T265_05582 [Opisthorchis viverrini]|uniref:Uncharacterized protein n=1 Tax=Opisthorchis viverrini TaxID=6198 RepID=A0A075AF38_OPIVI|nr:hypothetical protein T265_05582 [Opisthorchis viverrini]KER27334.1 hypothetical protein T265_05582 [Opisthorchis viverrini]